MRGEHSNQWENKYEAKNAAEAVDPDAEAKQNGGNGHADDPTGKLKCAISVECLTSGMD
jgi:hypothetical protein